MKIKTLEDIQNSKNILGSFTAYGSGLYKVSITYYTSEHAVTIECRAMVSFNKRLKAHHWCDIIPVFKPSDFEGEQIEKESGKSYRYSGDEDAMKVVFKALCKEIDKRNRVKCERYDQIPRLHIEAYQSFQLV